MEHDAVVEPFPRQLLDPGDVLGGEVGAQLDHHPASFEVEIERVFQILAIGGGA